MTETMGIEDYLAQGGVLSSPTNVPARYRGELLRLMATFVDSELAGSAGFADSINAAPGIKERIAAARIVLEKTDHAELVLAVMGTFGADTARYSVHHPWAARVARNADLGATRLGSDMRLSVFHYPLQGWVDAVTMNVLMGRAVGLQLEEFSRVSYAPLAEAFRAIAPREARHAELGIEGLQKIISTDEGREEVRVAVAFWRPQVAASFGMAGSSRFDTLKRFGLRHRPNEALLADWNADVDATLSALNLN
ncbi:Phenylacetic acid catabolic protein [Microvirga terricola]|uniref:Phenylacetic acid catabolic n=1 Tax=Microvirga terricola TaxID=2719797 RepID=A0ABX0VBW7_9HYPH|nr:Phenylacetic acid catabolic protein [Microvirga terricola]NIX75871.1 phenylacetic acid catabolic [Microvirga terricola]